MGLGIMVVDDETLIRQGIIARLKHLGYDFDAILEADDGETALKCYEQGKIQIVITDIKMTNVSGLDLIKLIKEKDENVQFVIVSGYDDFTYAEEAIRLGVNAYLLKPISNEKLDDVMKKVLGNIDKINKVKNDGVKIYVSSNENRELKFEQKINEILNISYPEEAQEVIENDDELRSLLDRDCKYIVGIVSIDMNSYRERNMEYNDVNIIRFTIKNIISELSEDNCFVVNNMSDNKQVYVILKGDDAVILRKRSERLFENLQSSLWKFAKMEVTIGVSNVSCSLCYDRLKEAKEAFWQRVVHGNGNLFYYEDIPVLSAEEFPLSELTLLRRYTAAQDIGNIEAIINSMLSDERVKRNSVSYIEVVWIQVMNVLLHTLNLSLNEGTKRLEHEMIDFSKMISTNSLSEVRQKFTEIIIDAMKGEISPETDAESKIRLAQKYIEEHYSEELSVSILAEKYFMSPNYFSTMFKKLVGVSAVNYMKKVRLEVAKKELTGTDRSIAEISELIGYNDSQYFFKLFKKETGVTPLQYRRGKNDI